MALQGVVFAFDAISTQKNSDCNHSLTAITTISVHSKAISQAYLQLSVANFQPQATIQQINKGHGRIEKRTVSISHILDGIPDFPGLQTWIRVQSERLVHRATIIEVTTVTRYYVASFIDTVQAFAARIRGYWGVENKVHYVRDVTQGARMLLVFAPHRWCKFGQSPAILPSICTEISCCAFIAFLTKMRYTNFSVCRDFQALIYTSFT